MGKHAEQKSFGTADETRSFEHGRVDLVTIAGSEIGLLGNWALSTSALAFIAGFGVEGVFVALESLVRRVFNISDPVRKAGD